MTKKTLLKTLFSILLISVLILLFTTPAAVVGSSADEIIENWKDAAEKIGLSIVVIGWIIAGILYLTSAGSPERIGIAKKALIAAVTGTVLIIIAKSGYEAIKILLKMD